MSESGLRLWNSIEASKERWQAFLAKSQASRARDMSPAYYGKPFPFCSCHPSHFAAVKKETHLNTVLNGPLEV